ncbi:hypothetical protein D9M70_426330 [compost metagenome]
MQLPQGFDHLFRPVAQRAESLDSNVRRRPRAESFRRQAFQQVGDVIFSKYGVGDRGSARKGLVAARSQFANQRPVRASAYKDEVARRIGAWIDGIAGGLECQ